MATDDHENDRTQSYTLIPQGTVISHYRIIEIIGVGGMGEVYLAEDTKLNRRVALKFLLLQFATDEDFKARFTREAQAAGALKHPNIVTIYEVSEYLGRPFFAMEFCEGQALQDLIKEQKLTIDDIIDLSIHICEGLQEAHNAGIIHRDVKPSNIILDMRGRPKLLDFGLATIEGTDKLTRTGSTLGTVGYMSPEQVRGEDVDARSDLFSLGVVIYEMLVGRPPFVRNNIAATLHSITHDSPESLTRYRSDVPDNLQMVVHKALEKEGAARYQNATDVINDLTRSRAAGEPGIETLVKKTKKREKLVVLPFLNLGPPGDEFFADGMTEEITSRLATVRSLGIISRTSAFQYKDTHKSMRQIGEELGVDYVIEGTVRWGRTGGGKDRVRISPQLIQVSDDTHLWAEQYDRVLEDIFEVQSEIAARIIERLDIALPDPERRALNARPTENLDAYQAFLRGMDYVRRPDRLAEDIRLGTQMFVQATELDSGFAQAYANLSLAYSLMYHLGYDRTEKCLSQAETAANRALQLEPELAEAHLALGHYYYRGCQDYNRALGEFAIAEKKLPHDIRILEAAAFIWRRQGKFNAAVENFKKAYELNPQDAFLPFEIANTYTFMRKYSEAEYYYDRSISQAPNQIVAYTHKAWNYSLWRGDVKKARATLEKMPKKEDPYSVFVWFWQELFEREYQAALRHLSTITMESVDSQLRLYPKASLMGLVYELMHESEAARVSYDSARGFLETIAKERPDDDRAQRLLGVVYAGLGRKDEAISIGKLAVEKCTVSEDAIVGPVWIEDLAVIYVMAREFDVALDQIEYLLSIPCRLSVSMLRLDPRWDPLHDHPRFQALLEKYE